ncbi:MAG: CHAT domain-containing protein [Acidobacteria bacterium]|nr:CHAT domain-containing protein [Acidobacteriota bacterium]MBI3422153.1 CHAT domain-containing protein [Acidobacteriota bacterium]
MKAPSTPPFWQRRGLGLPGRPSRPFVCGAGLLLSLAALLYLNASALKNVSTRPTPITATKPTLTLAQPIRQVISAGQTHRYTVQAPRASFLRFSLRPSGFGLIWAVYDAHGNIQHCSNSRRFGETHFSLLAEAPGKVVIEISKLDATTANLEYELQWLEQRGSAAQDARRVLTERTMEAAELLHEQQSTEVLRRSTNQYQLALQGWRALGDRHEEALTLFGLGLTHYYSSQEQAALGYLQQALQHWKALNDQEGEANAYLQLANAKTDLGQVPLAQADYLKALQLWEGLGNTEGQASAKIGLGVTNIKLGNFQQALSYYEQALGIHRQAGNRLGEVSALAGLGYTYLELGEEQDAIDAAEQQLALADTLQLSLQQELAHSLLGHAHLHLKEPEKALVHLQKALLLSEQHGHQRIQALMLRKIGVVHELRGELSQAGAFYQQALPLSKQVGNKQEEALTLNLIGNRYEAVGEQARALAYYRQALPICQKYEDRLGEITTRHNLAHAQRDLGRLAAAQQEIKRARQLIETLRERVANRQLRESYFATVQKSYGLYVDILMRQHERQPQAGFAARAWQMNEQARARTLREMLNESRAEMRTGLPLALLERERALQEQLNVAANRLLSEVKPEEQAALTREVRELRLQLATLEGELRQAAPGYAALTQPPLTDARTVQRQLLDGQTALLEYAFGEERSYVWLITPQQVRSWQLAKRSEIETQAQCVYERLTARLHAPQETFGEYVRQADAQYWQEAARLSEMLLPPELLAQLQQPSLLVVSDGALQYLPFCALPLPGAPAGTPLLTKFEITSLPSGAVLAELRRQRAARPPNAKLLAVLADPVYNSDDGRLRSTSSKMAGQALATTQPSAVSSGLSVRAHDGALIPLTRLFNADEEAEAIRKYAAPEQSLILKGFDVNRGILDGPQLSAYSILHFATHGHLDGAHPELSGLFLSCVQPDGKKTDGLLRMHEIYRLKLPAELIVLSACETALGKEVRGEGLIALTRGFMYAGATRVVASLWKVNDHTTPALMGRFYQGMLQEKRAPAAALRQAQLEMLNQPRTSAPFFWAAFILQGEPRNFSSPGAPHAPPRN